MIRILVLEEVSPAGLVILRSQTKVTADFIGQAPKLKVIGRPGTGVDNVDVAEATRRGIVVMNTPEGNAISAAEHALGLILALLRKIPQADLFMKKGKWERQRFMGVELNGKALGIIGFGKIGTEVAKRAKSFKLNVLVYDPYVSDAVARDHNVSLISLDELLAQSDIISLHAPLTASTKNIMNAGAIAKMKTGSYLINAARGELVDETALIDALKTGKL